MNNTRDLMDFGYRELDIAGDLLKTVKTNKDKSSLCNQVAIEFNPQSGEVFLLDEDYNVAMMNGEFLEDFLNCPHCGFEGFSEDIMLQGEECCKDYIKGVS